MTTPQFRRDLYQATARDYDRYRLAYPRQLTDDLISLAGASGSGTLLDLACGTGQLTFALHRSFALTWAVDQEPGMIEVVREKAAAAGAAGIRPLVCAAGKLEAPLGFFGLAVIGNAFHRLPRDQVAAGIARWLRPGGYLALAWSDGPSEGSAPWQQALSAAMRHWQARAGTAGRVPASYAHDRAARPGQAILTAAGLEPAGRREAREQHEWTPDTVTGFLLATSVLSRAALGGLAGEFGASIRRELLAAQPDGRLAQSVGFAVELYRRPAG
jgi:ubiquinone/menaquinone biosynthesis C-methylase UbiE